MDTNSLMLIPQQCKLLQSLSISGGGRFFDEVLLQGVASGLERKILHRVIPKSDEDTNNLSENGYTKSFLPGNVFEKMFYPLPRKLT